MNSFEIGFKNYIKYRNIFSQLINVVILTSVCTISDVGVHKYFRTFFSSNQQEYFLDIGASVEDISYG